MSDNLVETCEATTQEDIEEIEQLDLFGTEPAKKTPKKDSCGAKKDSCGAKKSASSASAPKELANDMERFVVITSNNDYRTYPADMSLEQIREDLEREYPAYSAKNTNWHTEEQTDRNRHLCIPTYKSSKAG